MNSGQLDKILRDMQSCRNRGGTKPSELEAIARRLGRVKSKRGKEPTWVSEQFPMLRPLSIPHHGSADLNKYTARAILDQLEADVEAWEGYLGTSEREGGDRR